MAKAQNHSPKSHAAAVAEQDEIRVFADLPADVVAKLDNAAQPAERSRSAQVRFVLKEWAAKQAN